MAPLFLLPLLAAAAPAAQPPFWRVDWGDKRCVLIREGGEVQSSLALRYVPGDRRGEIYVIGPRWTAADTRDAGSVRLRLDQGGGEAVEKFQSVKLPDGRFALGSNRLPGDFLDRFAKAGAVSLERKGKEFARIAVPEATRALAATRDCEDDMLKRWGVDPAAFHALKSPPRSAEQFGWITEKDYPQDALRKDQQGTVYVRLGVDAAGKVTACNVAISSGVPSLDDATCKAALRRGRYLPAIGPDDKPTAAVTIFYVVWQISG